MAALSICKGLPMSYNRDLQEVTPHLWRALDWARSTVRILDGCVSSLKFNLERLEMGSGAGFSTATEIADSLVRITGMPFRTAHRIVGRIAASGSRTGLAGLDEISREMAGFAASERGFSEADLKRALDPKSNVALRANTGGPAPSETERMIRDRQVRIAAGEERLAQRRSRVEKVLEKVLEELGAEK
jgi:argininosuccinate lyase